MIIKSLPPKKYIEMFSEAYELIQGDNYFFAVLPNEFDDFRQFSYVNGLNIASGGAHIDYITTEIVNRLRDVLIKKYKTIKPGDIRNKLMVVAVMKEFNNLKFDSQTKEKVTNSVTEIKSYFGDIDFDSLAKKILKNSAIIDPITEVYKLKEELKRRQEMKGLEKPKKKIKSEKYLPAIGTKKYLVIGEGASAVGGLIPVLGRKDTSFYELKGKPLNVITASHEKFRDNKELTELYQIIKHEDHQYIIVASDSDLDGLHIRGLLIGFIDKMLPEFKQKFGLLNTPVMVAKKNGKITQWSYNLFDKMKLSNGEESHYYKGLGSWMEKDLKEIVQKDTLEKMIQMVDFDSDQIIQDWLASENSDIRKDYIGQNSFSIASL